MDYFEPAPRTASKSGSRVRALGLLLGGLALFAVGFNLLERLVAPTTAPVAVPTAEHRSDPIEPIRPQVRKVGSDGVVIDAGELRRTTIVIDGSSEEVDLLLHVSKKSSSSPSPRAEASFRRAPTAGYSARPTCAQSRSMSVTKSIASRTNACRGDHGRPRD